MLIPTFLIVVVFLLLRWYYKPRKFTPAKDDGLLVLPRDADDHEFEPFFVAQTALARWRGLVALKFSTITDVCYSGNGLNKASMRMPESTLSFGRCGFLNKVLDLQYKDNIGPMVASLSRYINGAAAREHAAKCAVEETHRCALQWTTGKETGLFEGVSELAHKAVVRTLLGDDFYESGDELLVLARAVESEMGNFWSSVLPGWVPHPAVRRLRRARERIREIFMERLGRRDAAAVAGGPLEVDLPDYVTCLLGEESTAPLRHLLSSHHTALMLATHSSTVSAISWVVVCLLRHPDVMNAVKRDARRGETDQVLLRACVKETVRYYTEMKRLHLERERHRGPRDETFIPMNSDMSSLALEPVCYPHPDSWMPGRWINAENELVELGAKRGDGVHLVASPEERHKCPGEKMRMIIATQVLATLLRCYDISWASPEQPRSVNFEALDFDKIGSPWLKVYTDPVAKPRVSLTVTTHRVN